MPLLSCLSRTWSHIQGNLFPWLSEELGPLGERSVFLLGWTLPVDVRADMDAQICSAVAAVSGPLAEILASLDDTSRADKAKEPETACP